MAPAGSIIKSSPTLNLHPTNHVPPISKPKRHRQLHDSIRPTILIVEDNDDMRDFIINTIGKKFNSIEARDGLEALEILKNIKPDLIITDIMMPNMAGDELILKIREDKRFDQTPIIILTAKLDDDLKIRLLGKYCQDYLNKPFAQKELLIRVTNLVMMKKSKEILSSELTVKSDDILSLSNELTLRKRELQNSLESLQVAKEQAETASEMKTRLLATVSHELRTPLTSILLATELIQKRNLAAATTPQFKTILTSVKRLQGQIDHLIDYSYFQSGKMKLIEVNFLPQKLFDEVIEDMRFEAEKKHITLLVDNFVKEEIISDPRLIKIILHNLLSNSMNFTEKGSISLKAEITHLFLKLEILDSGSGIAKSDLKRIFEPFEQVEPIMNKTIPGIGLGLPFVKSILEFMKGSYEIESKLGVGSKITVLIPVKTLKSK